MATTFGTRPEDTVADSRGNVLSGVVIEVYPTEADANARTSLVSSLTSDTVGLWPYSDASSRSLLWARDPSGRVWPISSEEAIASISSKVDKGALVLSVTDYGAVGDGATDDTSAIQAALTAAAAGATILFPRTGSGSFYKTTAKLSVTTPNLRLVGTGRDYAAQIKCTTASVTMIEVKATGFVMDNVMLVGDGGTNGVGATVNGLDLYGDTDGNVDATIRGNIIGMAVGARVRARNALFDGTSVTSCLKGVIFDGIAAYHTGPNADQNRGNWVKGCRFHNIGVASSDAAVEFTTTAKVQHAVIAGNFFDSNGLGRHIVATGTSGDPHKGLFIHGNKHTEAGADVYALTYVQNSQIDGADIQAYVGASPTYGRGFVLNNCTDVMVSNVRGLQLGQTGAYGQNNTRVSFVNVKFRALGGDPGTTAHGFDFDSTNTGISYDVVNVNTTDGYGINGSPASSRLGRYTLESCTLGTINSTTLGDESVWIPAAAMFAITGSPTLAGLQGLGYPQAMAFDAAAVEQVTASIPQLPQHWNTFSVQLVWAPTTAGGGNVIWDLGVSEIVNGAVPSAATTSSFTVAAPTTTGQIVSSTTLTGLTATPNPRIVRFDRNASSGSDTYAADAHVLGIRLIRTA